MPVLHWKLTPYFFSIVWEVVVLHLLVYFFWAGKVWLYWVLGSGLAGLGTPPGYVLEYKKGVWLCNSHYKRKRQWKIFKNLHFTGFLDPLHLFNPKIIVFEWLTYHKSNFFFTWFYCQFLQKINRMNIYKQIVPQNWNMDS